MKTDWLCLVAIMDWYSRYVLDWRISDSMEIGFVLEASHAALRKAAPEIMNGDQGSHFTSPQYTEIFLEAWTFHLCPGIHQKTHPPGNSKASWHYRIKQMPVQARHTDTASHPCRTYVYQSNLNF